MLNICVYRNVVACELTGILRLDTTETTGAASQTCVWLTSNNGVLLFARFSTKRKVQRVADGQRKINVEVVLFLNVATYVKVHLRQRVSITGAERRVRRVVKEVVELVLTVAVADVVQHTALELTLYTNYETCILLIAIKKRCEASGQTDKALLAQARRVVWIIRIASWTTVSEPTLRGEGRVIVGTVEEAVTTICFSGAETGIQL